MSGKRTEFSGLLTEEDRADLQLISEAQAKLSREDIHRLQAKLGKKDWGAAQAKLFSGFPTVQTIEVEMNNPDLTPPLEGKPLEEKDIPTLTNTGEHTIGLLKVVWEPCSEAVLRAKIVDCGKLAEVVKKIFAVETLGGETLGKDLGANPAFGGLGDLSNCGKIDAGKFSGALQALENGKRVARFGWNGKGMWLRQVAGKDYYVDSFTIQGLELLPWIGMKTADGKFVPWLASQSDILANDWIILEEK